MRRLSGPVSSALVAGETYLRAVFVLVGAALALALGIADFTLLALAVHAGFPVWTITVIGVVLVGGPLTVGLLPGVRQIEGVAVQSLLAVEFRDGPPGPATTWAQRRRTLTWFLLHLAAGAAVVAAVIGAGALAPSWWSAAAGSATAVAVLLVGRLLARLGPVLLGPSSAERLHRLESEASRARERTRIARELHDSLGHALSVVTVQAGAGRKLLPGDPAFAEQALETIETMSRRAAADLDNVLGLLRDDRDQPTPATPAPDLSGLDGLLTAARSAGLAVSPTILGDPSGVPLVVSREAYRIVQEGLTNALKYSADGTATLHLSVDRRAVTVRMTNPADGRRRGRAGRGLRGIDERATLLGGTTSGAAAEGCWTLTVTLPTWAVSR